MKLYRITITMDDGSRGEHRGQYADAFAALAFASRQFPRACAIEVERVPS